MASSTPPRPTSKSSTQASKVTSTPPASSLPLFEGPSPISGISSASSIRFLDSPSSWKPRKRQARSSLPSFRPLCGRPVIRWAATTFLLVLAAFSLHHLPSRDILHEMPEEWRSDARIQEVIRPVTVEKGRKPKESPEDWIKKQSALSDEEKARQPRPRAALISLVRNEELDGILRSMRQLEYHWNHLYKYPWIFFSEKPFSDEFKVDSCIHLTATT